jgi:hypothetical protein
LQWHPSTGFPYDRRQPTTQEIVRKFNLPVCVSRRDLKIYQVIRSGIKSVHEGNVRPVPFCVSLFVVLLS